MSVIAALAFVFGFFYVLGVALAFGKASIDREFARGDEYRAACRSQVRAPLWPLDVARWTKGQILTAIIDQKEQK